MMHHIMLRDIHHLEHGQSIGTDKSDHKYCCQHEEDDIEHRFCVLLRTFPSLYLEEFITYQIAYNWNAIVGSKELKKVEYT